MVMDAGVFAVCIAVRHGVEVLISYFNIQPSLELDVTHIALIVSTVGTGSAYVLKDLWNLISSWRSRIKR
jgi:hypothetical protein